MGRYVTYTAVSMAACTLTEYPPREDAIMRHTVYHMSEYPKLPIKDTLNPICSAWRQCQQLPLLTRRVLSLQAMNGMVHKYRRTYPRYLSHKYKLVLHEGVGPPT